MWWGIKTDWLNEEHSKQYVTPILPSIYRRMFKTKAAFKLFSSFNNKAFLYLFIFVEGPYGRGGDIISNAFSLLQSINLTFYYFIIN